MIGYKCHKPEQYIIFYEQTLLNIFDKFTCLVNLIVSRCSLRVNKMKINTYLDFQWFYKVCLKILWSSDLVLAFVSVNVERSCQIFREKGNVRRKSGSGPLIRILGTVERVREIKCTEYLYLWVFTLNIDIIQLRLKGLSNKETTYVWKRERILRSAWAQIYLNTRYLHLKTRYASLTNIKSSTIFRFSTISWSSLTDDKTD